MRERHNLKHQGKPCTLAVCDVVILKSEERNRRKLPLGIVQELFPGRDGVVRAVKLRSDRNFLDQCSMFTLCNFLVTQLSVHQSENLMLMRPCSGHGDWPPYRQRRESGQSPKQRRIQDDFNTKL